MGVCCLVLQIVTLFPDQTVIFPHPFPDLVSIIHTRFQTRPYYLDEVANKKISLNTFRIGLLLSLSYSFEIETSNMFILFLENHSRFQTKMGEVFTRFQTKTAKKNTLWGETYLYGLYNRVSPPPPGTTFLRALASSGKTLFATICWLLSLIFIRKA